MRLLRTTQVACDSTEEDVGGTAESRYVMRRKAGNRPTPSLSPNSVFQKESSFSHGINASPFGYRNGRRDLCNDYMMSIEVKYVLFIFSPRMYLAVSTKLTYTSEPVGLPT